MDFVTILGLVGIALVPVLLSVVFYLLENKTGFVKIPYQIRQILIGICFAGASILGIQFGLKYENISVSVSNCAPLVAGLIFGGPSGIIAGLIGGLYRFLSTYWGMGQFSQLACSIGCLLAGVFGAICRKFMFDNKIASWLYGLILAGTTEVLHMLLLFITNMDEVYQAYVVVSYCALPVILSNALASMLSLMLVTKIGRKGPIFVIKRTRPISQVFQFVLMVSVVIAFAATSVFTFVLQTRLANATSDSLLSIHLDDVKKDVQEESDENLMNIALKVSEKVSLDSTEKELDNLLVEYNISEINLVDSKGIIIQSTNSSYLDFDMSSGKQSKEFLVLLDGTADTIVQSYCATAFDSNVFMKYAGVRLTEGFVQVGYDASYFQAAIADEIRTSVRNRHVGEKGGFIICDEKGNIIFDKTGHQGQSIYTSDGLEVMDVQLGVHFIAQINDVECYCIASLTEGFYIVAYRPTSEVLQSRSIAVSILAFMEILVLSALFIHIYILLKRLIVDNIHEINKSLERITNGDLNVNVSVRSNEEFMALSDDINATVSTLKRYIAEAESRIDKELEFARQIQMSSLPSVFPPYPERKDFDVYANMDTAKEVGGDFYDFYMTDKNHLAFMIADVSGKGIPAALFMMKAKTLIKNLAESGKNVADVFTLANASLSENNDAEMFVTAWMGILDLSNGTLQYVNAGHTPPLLARGSGRFEYLNSNPNFILAGMDDTVYQMQEIVLSPTDRIFLYTDGITEATNREGNLYGEERLLRIISQSSQVSTPKEICELVKKDVDSFVNGFDQSDDITMLAMRLDHIRTRHDLYCYPIRESIRSVMDYVESRMSLFSIPEMAATKAMVATDEIYSNFVKYSKATKAHIYVKKLDGNLILLFENNGEKFDPNTIEEPDVTKSADERDVGGLGLFIVKNTAKEFAYEYENDMNRIRVVYSLTEED
jgi:serine phosphatase RsbU (regulator of sigma subunit)/anti-sigma regulatory factor (Ser/Thr protein kinase)